MDSVACSVTVLARAAAAECGYVIVQGFPRDTGEAHQRPTPTHMTASDLNWIANTFWGIAGDALRNVLPASATSTAT